MKKFFVTTPIYYMNGEPHLGHYYSTTLADVFARYYSKTENGSFFLTGTDEHGQKVADKAQSLGKSPQIFVDELALSWQNLWDKLGLKYDFFIRTSNTKHKLFAQYILQKLKENYAIYEKKYDALYCVGAESFVTKSELREGGLCPDHDEEPQIISETNWFFKLSEYKLKVKELIEKDIIKIQPKSRKNETLELLMNDDLGDFSVTRQNVEWGILVPFAPDQTIYVWIDALFNYMSAVVISKNIDFEKLSIQELIQEISDIWTPDLHIIGKDILKFHAIYWPAFLLALGLDENQLPKKILVTGMFVSEGRKMSKSLGNTIFPQDVITEFESLVGFERANEVLRFFVISEMKIGNDGDITLERVKEIYEKELANKVGNTFSRVVGMAKKYDMLGERLNQENYHKFEIEISQIIDNYFEQSDIYSVSKFLLEKLAEIAREIEEIKPWELYKENKLEELEKYLSKWLSLLEIYTEKFEIIMPNTAESMKKLIKAKEEGLSIFPKNI